MVRVPTHESPKLEAKRFLRSFDRQVKELEERRQKEVNPPDPSSKDTPPEE
jgi:hypothetical protein